MNNVYYEYKDRFNLTTVVTDSLFKVYLHMKEGSEIIKIVGENKTSMGILCDNFLCSIGNMNLGNYGSEERRQNIEDLVQNHLESGRWLFDL